MKNKLLIILNLILLIQIPLFALDDILIFTGEDNVSEVGVSLTLPYNPGGLNPSNKPSFRVNSVKNGINTSDVCLAIVTNNNSLAWNTMVDLNILANGITPQMMSDRRYLKVMVWRNITSQEMCIQVNGQNWESDNNIYRSTPTSGQWVDLVIDLNKLRGSNTTKWSQANWSDSIIKTLRVMPIAWNKSPNTQVVLRVDNIALSDNDVPRISAPTGGSSSQEGDITICSFEDNSESELGLINIRATYPNNNQFLSIPDIYDNPQQNGINTSAKCLKMTTANDATRWQCQVLANIGGSGITPLMVAKRKYLKIMVWRDFDLNNFRVLVNANTSDWNSNTYLCNTKPLKGEWVDMVFDLSKSYGGTIWGNQTLTSIMFQPIENNSIGLGLPVTVLIDNIALSDDPFPRTPIGTELNPEIEQARQNMFNYWMKKVAIDDTIHLTQLSNGSWSDINYKETAAVYWKPIRHLERIKGMSCHYASLSDTTTALAYTLRDGIIKGLQYWEDMSPRSENWFYNDISKQFEFAPILILGYDIIPKDLVRQLCKYFIIGNVNPTGANLTCMARGVFTRGVLLNNIQTVREAVAYMESVIGISSKNGDGIHVDNSYIFHGKQVFSFNYNAGMIRDAGEYMLFAKDLSFGFKQQYVENLSRLIREYTRWFTWGKWFDYNTNGRVISMPNRQATTDMEEVYLNFFPKLDTEHAQTYSYMSDCATNEKIDTLTGNRMFYRAEYMVHRRKKHYIGLKMSSSRISGSEMGNGQNIKGYWLGFGATTIYRKGDEFSNIFPLWDWTKIPGTTAANELPSFGWDLKQNATFVGGVSDSITGIACMMIDKLNLYARKSWFMFNDEMVALGAGISSKNSNDISTSIAQCYLRGDVLVNGAIVGKSDLHTLNDVSYINHDSISYFFPTKPIVKMLNKEKKARWNDISTVESADTVTAEVFNIWFDHGNKPVSDEYAYIVVPNMGKEDAITYSQNMPIIVLSNTPKIQAVTHKHEKKTGVIFYEAGEQIINSNLTVRAYQPCALLIDHNGKYIKVTLSDPNQNLLNAKIDLVYDPLNKETLNFILPNNNYSGAGTICIGEKEYTDTSIDVSVDKPMKLNISYDCVDNIINIYGSEKSVLVTLYDMFGKKVYNEIVDKSLDIKNISPGVYMLNIGNVYFEKIVKNK